MRQPLGVWTVVTVLSAAITQAQDVAPQRLEDRLIKVLRENRTITEAQATDLRRVAEDYRRDEERRLRRDAGLDREIDVLAYAARFTVSPFGEVPYTEGDIRRTGSFQATLGVNAQLHHDDAQPGLGEDRAIGADLAARYASVSLLAELQFLWRSPGTWTVTPSNARSRQSRRSRRTCAATS